MINDALERAFFGLRICTEIYFLINPAMICAISLVPSSLG